MTILAVPYHLDEYLPGLDFPVTPAEVVTAPLPSGARWERLAVLYRAVARAVAADARRGGRRARPGPARGDLSGRRPDPPPPLR